MDRAMVRGIVEAFDHENVNYCALRHWEEFISGRDRREAYHEQDVGT